ncbi:hypothetical protein N7453_011225 [Penicillium expansum]|nr:hypothetical protein N7453_011225 [Penicillium expansum]
MLELQSLGALFIPHHPQKRHTHHQYISQIIYQLNVIERRYLCREYNLSVLNEQGDKFVDGLEAAFLKLYMQILEFEARAVCHLTKNSITRALNDMFLVDSWGSMMSGIKESEAMCQSFIRVIDSEKLHTGMEESKSQLHDIRKDTRETQTMILDQEIRKKEESQKKKWNKFLDALSTSRYEDNKDRNQDRIEGTCEWSTSHPLFNGWRNSERSSLLWLSADPGCGKSVLAKYLIDHVIPTTEGRTTCYFFFKADSTEQRSIASALRALLHQLFTQKPILREMNPWIPERFATDGGLLTDSFSALWEILTKVSTNGDGEVSCVLDALDECAESDRPQLTQALDKFYRRDILGSKGILRFLITSRPYVHIQREFQLLKDTLPTIHLSGEDGVEADKIEQEINLVIHKRVDETAAKLILEKHEQSFLQNELLMIPNRTYLWVTLIFDAIENSLRYTNKRVQEMIKSLPKTVDEAYERILSRSPDEREARKLLHVVVSASRPLTVQEMRVALGLSLGNRQIEDLDLEPEARFATTVRNLCGLFVTIVDSKIYLLHQTAKEFLVPRSVPAEFIHIQGASPNSLCQSSHGVENVNYGRSVWKHSFLPVESNRVLLEICMSCLLLNTFEQEFWEFRGLISFGDEHVLLLYSSENWTLHFRNAQLAKGSYLLPFARELCQPKSQRLKTWLKICSGYSKLEIPTTELMVASQFGLEPIVEMLLETGYPDIDKEDPNLRRTPLSVAAEGGSQIVVKMFIDAGTRQLNLSDSKTGTTPLMWAATRGNIEVVKLLLDQASIAVDIPSFDYRTPLSYAAENGHEEIVGLLLDKGANPDELEWAPFPPIAYAAQNGHVGAFKRLLKTTINLAFQSKTGDTLLSMAAEGGHVPVVEMLLLTPNVNPDCRNFCNFSPLLLAAQSGHLQVVRLLTETHSVDLDVKDQLYDRTPLFWAAINGYEQVLEHLVEAGAKDVECAGRWPRRTALSYAAEEGNETVTKLLLETGLANPNSQSIYGRTPLSFAADEGYSGIVRQLLALESIETDLADSSYGRTPLSWAAARGHAEVVQLLLDTHAVDLFSRDSLHNRTPGMWAAVNGHRDVAELLQFVETEDSGQATPVELVLDKSSMAPFEELQES